MNTGTPARSAKRREILRRVVPVDAAARHDHGPLGAGQQRGQLAATDVGIGRGWRARCDVGRWGSGASRSSTTVIRRSTGISTKTGPGRPVSAVRIAVVSTSGIWRVSAHRPRALRDGPQQVDLLHLLERAEPAQAERRRAADEQHRAARGVGVGDAGDRVGDAGPRRHHRHADVAREPRVGVRGVRGRPARGACPPPAMLLGEAAVVDRQDVAAAQREDVAHARLLERARHEVPPVQIRHAQAGGAVGMCTISSFSRSGSSKNTA